MIRRIYILEDEPMMAECLALAAQQVPEVVVETFPDAVSAMQRINVELPELLLLDVMLGGPDGFTFLNEMLSYPDTAKIPVIIVSTLDFSRQNLEHYGVVATLDKTSMTPADIATAIARALEGTDVH